MHRRSLGHRAPLLWLVLPLSAGLLIARTLGPGHAGVFLAVGAGGALVALLAAWVAAFEQLWAVAIITAFTSAGIGSYELTVRRLQAWQELPPREVRALVQIERVFAPADARKASGLGRIIAVEEPVLPELVGQRVYFSVYHRAAEPVPARSAIDVMAGVLAPLPAPADSRSFDGYLASSGINFKLLRAHVGREAQAQLAYYRFCDHAAARFNRLLGLGIEEKRPTLAGLLRAMMLGETRELSEEQHTIFMQSGTMHLFAISGLNIGVIAGAIEALLRLARGGALTRFCVGMPVLWLFVDITGAAPSAVRAFAMAAFAGAAFVAQRPANPLAALVGSAAVVLVVSPLQLFSASFLMSYAIVAALLLLGLPLSETWDARATPFQEVPRATMTRWQRGVAGVVRTLVLALGIGVATSLVSVITSVQFFQLLTPGALLANLVLIPAAMLVTLAGFVSLLAGLLGFAAGAVVCNHAAALCLLVIEALVKAGVAVPGAFVPAQFKAPWMGGTALTLILATLLYGYAVAWHPRRGGWWPPFAVVALVLAFGVTFTVPVPH